MFLIVLIKACTLCRRDTGSEGIVSWEGQRKSLEVINQYLTEENMALHFTGIPVEN